MENAPVIHLASFKLPSDPEAQQQDVEVINTLRRYGYGNF
jgi:hypothetical protein